METRESIKFLSVFIPNYNQSDSVIAAIKSMGIYNQADIEIIIVDDGSEISIFNKLASEIKSFQNVKLFRNETNLGLVKNWNECIKKSSGTWIGLLCCDDEYHPGALPRIYKILTQIKEPALVIQDRSISNESEYFPAGIDTSRKLKLPLVSGNFWHRTITEQLGGFDERLKYSPDGELWHRIAIHFPVIKIEFRVAIYHMHQENYMWKTWRQPDFLDQVRLLGDVLNHQLYPELHNEQQKIIADQGIIQTIDTILDSTIFKKGMHDIFKTYINKRWDASIKFSDKYHLIIRLIDAAIRNIKSNLLSMLSKY